MVRSFPNREIYSGLTFDLQSLLYFFQFWLNWLKPLKSPQHIPLDYSILIFPVKIVVFRVRASFYSFDKPIFITETALPNARLLGLVSKLYPINMHFMHNEDLTRFTQIRQNQASEIKALLRKSYNLAYSLFNRRIFRQEISYLNLPFRCIIPGLSVVRVIASRHFNVGTFCFDVHVKTRSISVVCGWLLILNHEVFLKVERGWSFRNGDMSSIQFYKTTEQ